MDTSLSFGTLIGNPPPARAAGPDFRIVILGDFTGRANRGQFDDSDSLVDRKPVKIEFDTIDEVIEELAPRVRLPVGGSQSVLELEFSELDAFDADELFDRIDLLDEAQGVGRRIERSIEKAVEWIRNWSPGSDDGAENVEPSRAVVIPAVESLSELTSLAGRPTASDDDAQDAGDVLETLCSAIMRGPAGDDEPSKQKLLAAAAECTNTVARAVLHHPDFQALEGIWRELEWLLRRVDKGGRVKVVLFDISAEEFAADLAAADDLTQTGLYRLLVERVAEGKKPQPISVIVGRYQFDYCRAHAELLGRMGKISARLNAPFLTGISPRLLADNFKLKDEELLDSWNGVRALPSSAYVGVALPGFLLRLPYGSGGTSTEKFEFEEFDSDNVPGCLLWGNPGTFCAALIAGGYLKEGKWEFDLNAHRVLDKLPLYVCRDNDDEPTAMATEVQFALSVSKTVGSLGLIPLQSVKDRDSIQVSEIRSLSTVESRLCGAWAAGPPSEATAASPEVMAGETSAAAVASASEPPTTTADPGEMDPELAALLGETPAEASSSDSEMDPELAALLGDSGGDSSDSTNDDDDDLDPELRALLGD